MRRDRLTQESLGTSYKFESQVNNVENDLFCDIDCLPHTDADAEKKYGKLVPVEDEYPDADEEIGEIEKIGLEIAGGIQDQSNRLGRRRKHNDEE